VEWAAHLLPPGQGPVEEQAKVQAEVQSKERVGLRAEQRAGQRGEDALELRAEQRGEEREIRRGTRPNTRRCTQPEVQRPEQPVELPGVLRTELRAANLAGPLRSRQSPRRGAGLSLNQDLAGVNRMPCTVHREEVDAGA
jgi:hypothetical protein